MVLNLIVPREYFDFGVDFLESRFKIEICWFSWLPELPRANQIWHNPATPQKLTFAFSIWCWLYTVIIESLESASQKFQYGRDRGDSLHL